MDFKNIQDVLPDGKTKLSVKAKTDKDTGQHRQSKNNKWMYYTKFNNEYFNLFADDDIKSWFDAGVIWAECGSSVNGGRWIKYLADGDIETQAQNNAPAPQPAPQQEKPDWDAIALGKCRTLFAVEAFKLGKELNTETAKQCNEWAEFCLTGSIKKTEEVPLPEPTVEDTISVEDLPFSST
jgi:hypothetical protein